MEVVTPAEVYSGDRLAEAPDLLIGYDSYYGASEESTQGQIVEWDYESNPVPVADNLDGFSGSHLMAPSVVPGVLLLDRPIGDGHYDLTDLTATLLDYYGLPPAEGMVGTSILEN